MAHIHNKSGTALVGKRLHRVESSSESKRRKCKSFGHSPGEGQSWRQRFPRAQPHPQQNPSQQHQVFAAIPGTASFQNPRFLTLSLCPPTPHFLSSFHFEQAKPCLRAGSFGMSFSSPCKRAPAGFRDSPASSSILPAAPRTTWPKRHHSCRKPHPTAAKPRNVP